MAWPYLRWQAWDKPNIGLLSEEFLEDDAADEDRKTLAVELLEKLLRDEIKARARNNVVQGKLRRPACWRPCASITTVPSRLRR